jgi:hypothetical protein
MTRKEKHLILATAGVDERTLKRWLRGEAVWGATDQRIREAAAKLKIQLPARPAT